MRRATAWFVVVGVVLVGWPNPAEAADGFWVTLAAGVSGSSAAADYDEFWFETPHAPPLTVERLNGLLTAQATTGGGMAFFTGAGTPVLLPTTDGYATISPAGGPPFGSGGLSRFAGGSMASGPPLTGAPAVDAHRLTLGLSDPAADGSRVLSVGLTDPDGTLLGEGWVSVPGDGWWVIGLGPGTGEPSDSLPIFDWPPEFYDESDDWLYTTGSGSKPDPNGGGDDSGDEAPVVMPDLSTDYELGITGIVTPEPASVVLLTISGLGTVGWCRFRRG